MAYRQVPKKPPRWLEEACYRFALACRANEPGAHISINVGSGSIDMVNDDGTVYMCQEGDWFMGVEVNG